MYNKTSLGMRFFTFSQMHFDWNYEKSNFLSLEDGALLQVMIKK
jgi:hypothetical protein